MTKLVPVICFANRNSSNRLYTDASGTESQSIIFPGDDPVSLVAFWVLVGVAIGTFAVLENWGKINKIIHRRHH